MSSTSKMFCFPRSMFLCALVAAATIQWGCDEQNTGIDTYDAALEDVFFDARDAQLGPTDSELHESDTGPDAEVDATIKPDEDASSLDFIYIENIEITEGRSDSVHITFPDDVQSVLLFATGEEDVLYVLEHIESPTGERLIAENPDGVEITESHRRLTPFPGPFVSPNRSGAAGLGFASVRLLTTKRYSFPENGSSESGRLRKPAGQLGDRSFGHSPVTIDQRKHLESPSLLYRAAVGLENQR